MVAEDSYNHLIKQVHEVHPTIYLFSLNEKTSILIGLVPIWALSL